MKAKLPVFFIFCLLLVACVPEPTETMVLLDEKIAKVSISKSNGFGGMNEDILLTFKDEQSLNIFEKAITTAIKQPGLVDTSEPEYDVMVEYDSTEGELPTHAIHLWIGKENEKSTFMYIADDSIYLTSAKMTGEIRKLIHPNE